jgi:hypothetical protein
MISHAVPLTVGIDPSCDYFAMINRSQVKPEYENDSKMSLAGRSQTKIGNEKNQGVRRAHLIFSQSLICVYRRSSAVNAFFLPNRLPIHFCKASI